MMVKPTVQELLKKAKNRYELVIATSKRARQIASGAEVKTKVKEESPVTLAAQTIIILLVKKNLKKKSVKVIFMNMTFITVIIMELQENL